MPYGFGFSIPMAVARMNASRYSTNFKSSLLPVFTIIRQGHYNTEILKYQPFKFLNFLKSRKHYLPIYFMDNAYLFSFFRFTKFEECAIIESIQEHKGELL